jgi:microcystin degradation protein MlrC
MLPHVMRQGSADSPNRELQARCKAMEAEGALCASLFVGFPNADIRDAGLSALLDKVEQFIRRAVPGICSGGFLHVRGTGRSRFEAHRT